MKIMGTTSVGRQGFAGPAIRAAAILACALAVSACNTDQQLVTGVPDVPTDYRLRHPITIKEAARTLQLFVGSNRGELNPTQRAKVLAFAESWRNEATGGVIVDLPVGSSNERAAAQAMPEIRSILAASGVPLQSILVRGYRADPHRFATVRITYPKMAAQAGPCGAWPEDIGPSYNRDYFENQPYWNFGCASQRNLAAMVANPSDLVEPRGETPVYAMRRTMVLEKYRAGQTTDTQYSNPNAGKIATVGQ